MFDANNIVTYSINHNNVSSRGVCALGISRRTPNAKGERGKKWLS